MKIRIKTTEKSPQDLSKLVVLQQRQLEEKDKHIEHLEFRLQCALRHRYASRQEKLDSNHPQLNLFNEATFSDEDNNDESEESAEDKIAVPSHARTKRGRKPLPKDLPRLRREYDIPRHRRGRPQEGPASPRGDALRAQEAQEASRGPERSAR